MIELLTPLWQRVLQKPEIGIESNFFDLGGDPTLALKLSAEIARACERTIPSEMIFHAPTIAAQAAILAQPTTPRFLPLVPLKAGAGLPIFIAQGVGGNVLDFFPLARHMRTKHPIYGMQARGIDGMDEPFDRVEDMAQFFLDAIKELQPNGPYVLVGFSFGGLVTLEMARRLAEASEEVALMAMVESYPPPNYMPFGQRARIISRLVKYHVATVQS
jgi:pimeloyl-ACP methyl ester carboxylesterase